MSTPEVTAVILGLLMLIPTVASLTRFDHWWVRGFDFPRLQIGFLILVVLVHSLLVFSFNNVFQIVLVVFLGLSFIYQCIKIYPYTFFARRQVAKYKGRETKARISILVSNVLTTNTNYQKFLNLVQEQQPDVILTLETDLRWERELATLEEEYPYTVKIPQDNLYGMHLYSKLEFVDMEVKFLITEEIPSIHGRVKLRNGEIVKIHCLHPKPPSPTEDSSSTRRDAELLLVGKEIKKNEEPTLVFGDLNDVAWSRTTRLFQKMSGLLDPRIGRGFYNTFHTGYPIFRWPLDHVFHTDDFSLIRLKRLRNIGSDHFPIFIDLVCKKGSGSLEEKPEEADEEEKQWAEEKIEKGKPKVKEL